MRHPIVLFLVFMLGVGLDRCFQRQEREDLHQSLAACTATRLAEAKRFKFERDLSETECDAKRIKDRFTFWCGKR